MRPSVGANTEIYSRLIRGGNFLCGLEERGCVSSTVLERGGGAFEAVAMGLRLYSRGKYRSASFYAGAAYSRGLREWLNGLVRRARDSGISLSSSSLDRVNREMSFERFDNVRKLLDALEMELGEHGIGRDPQTSR